MNFVKTASAALFSAGLLAAPAAAQDSQPANEAVSLLSDVITLYSSADTISAKVDVDIDIDANGQKQNMMMDSVLHIDKPNSYYRSTMEDGSSDVMSVKAGAGALYIQEYDAMVAMETPTLKDAVEADMRANIMFLPMLASAESANSAMEEMGLEGLEMGGSGEYNGHAVSHLKGTSDGESYTFHVASEGSPMLHGITIAPQEGVTVEIAFSDQTVGEPIDSAKFDFSAPEGVSKYDDMAAFMKAMRGPEPSDALLAKTAPDFELNTVGGESVKLSDLKGKVVVLDFWATWCGPCVRALPILTEVTSSMADKDVVFYAVNLRETEEQVKGFYEKHDMTFPVLMDKEASVAQKYFVEGIPQTVIVGKDGTVQAVHVGMAPNLRDQLTTELTALTSGEKLAVAENAGE